MPFGPSPNARRVVPREQRKRNELTHALDTMPVWTEENEESFWCETTEGTNHVPAAILYAERRNPGKEYVWEYEDIGVRIFRIK